MLTRIVSHAVQLSGTDGGAIYEYDEGPEEFHLRATDHLDEAGRGWPAHADPPGEGVAGRMAVTREPVQIPDIAEAGAPTAAPAPDVVADGLPRAPERSAVA